MYGTIIIAREGRRLPFLITRRNTESISVTLEVRNRCIYAKSDQHTYIIDLECAKSCRAHITHNIDSHETCLECKKMGYMIDGRVCCSGLKIYVNNFFGEDGDNFEKILKGYSFYIRYTDNDPDYSREV